MNSSLQLKIIRTLLFAFCLALLTVATSVDAATISTQRPRLMFATELCSQAPAVSQVAARTAKQPWKSWFTRMSTESFHTAALNWLVRQSLGQAESLDSIAESAIKRMETLPERNGNFYNGVNLQNLSLAFDWLYDYPGFDSNRKAAVREKMLLMAEKLIDRVEGREVVYGTDIMHNYCSNAALAVGLAGLALWEGPDDSQAGRLLQIASDWYFEGVFPAMEMMEGGWHEGMAYSLNHFLEETPIWLAAYRTATGEDWFARIKLEQGNWMEQWIYFCMANLRPDYTFARSGDLGASRMLPDLTLRQALEITVSAYDNSHGRFLLDELQDKLGDRALAPRSLWKPLIFYAPNRPSANYRSLQPSKMIDPDGLGHFTMRSGWGPDDSWVRFECGDFFGSHNHLDQGQFTIYHKGALALDSGHYDGYTEHHKKYSYRSIAHNTMLIRDPMEIIPSHRFESYPSDGGQRALDYYFDNNNLSLSDYWSQYRDGAYADMADILAWETTAKYDYVEGDLTSAYNSTRVTDPGARPKIGHYSRRLLFIKPDIVVVWDQLDALDAEYEKAWLLHTVNKPRQNPDGTVTITENRGQLVLTPLLPENVEIRKIGGPGREFEVNGRNMVLEHHPNPPAPAQPGAWRLEVIPEQQRKDDTFLNVMELGDAGGEPRYDFERAGTTTLEGALSDSLVILFARHRGTGEDAMLELILPEPINPGSRVFICGLVPGGIYELHNREHKLTTCSAGKAGVIQVNIALNVTGTLRFKLIK
jgi:hypothetical protein